MEKLNKDDINEIADAVAKKIVDGKSAFLVDPETHYNHHQEFGNLLDAMGDAKTALIRWFIRLVCLGTLFIAYLGIKSGFIFPDQH